MRIVVFGVNNFIGATLTRYLVDKVNPENLILCSPTGDTPRGLYSKFTVNIADIRYPEHLNVILQEGDIVFNGQVDISLFNRLIPADQLILHYQGIINLLKVATTKKVRHIITFIPAILTWEDQSHPIDEKTIQRSDDPTHQIFQRTLEVCELYWENQDIGEISTPEEWFGKNFEEEQDVSTEDQAPLPSTDFSIAPAPDGKPTTQNLDAKPSAPNLNAKPNLDAKPSVPNLNAKPNLDAKPSAPNLNAKPNLDAKPSVPNLNAKPNLDAKPSAPNLNAKPNLDAKPKDSNRAAKLSPDLTGKSPTAEENNEDDVKESIPILSVVRAPFVFGPFDPELSFEFCKAVKLERISLPKKRSKKISWITPDDIGEAFRKITNKRVEGQFIVKSFDASILEIISSLEKVNGSKTEISFKRKSRFKNLRKKIFENPMKDIVKDKQVIFEVLTEKEMTVNSSFAEKVLDWNGQSNIEKIARKTLQWFKSYITYSER